MACRPPTSEPARWPPARRTRSRRRPRRTRQPQALAEVAIDEVKCQEPDDGPGGDPVGSRTSRAPIRAVASPKCRPARCRPAIEWPARTAPRRNARTASSTSTTDERAKKVVQAAAIEDGGQRRCLRRRGLPQRKPITKRAEESVILRGCVPRVSVGDHLHVRHRATQAQPSPPSRAK